MDISVAADVGGTFTDFVSFDGSTIRGWKTLTTPVQSDGVMTGLDDCDISEDTVFLHGTTVATNAMLEGIGARVALVTTSGFEDLVEIGRQKRPSLYDTAVDRPDPLVARADRIGHGDFESTREALSARAPDAIALALLDSYLDPSAEQVLAGQIQDAFPDIPLSVGSKVSPAFREYERIATTVLNAYLTPGTARYLQDLAERIGVRRADVMTSSGGMLPFAAATEVVGQLTLSGPAGGVVASNALKEFHGIDSAISFDMGGTSTDVCRIGSDGVTLASHQILGSRVNRVPSMPIRTVGAGGGSIAWLDSGGSLRVGPRSAGAQPGPACYGLGGITPTVTDANLVLGYMPEEATLGGSVKLDRNLALAALSRLGASVGMGPLEAAGGVIEIVDAHMERAIRSVSVEEGFDPRLSSLIAYGGAGALHATRLARALGMRSVLVPPLPGVFSALGLMMARPRIEVLVTLMRSESDLELPNSVAELEEGAIARFREIYGGEPESVASFADVRYEGQSHEVSVPYRRDRVGADFAAEHNQRFGFVLEDVSVEVVNIRAVAAGISPVTWESVDSPSAETPCDPIPIELSLAGRMVPGSLWQRSGLPFGSEVRGPALIVDDSSTILLGEQDVARVLREGTMEITW